MISASIALGRMKKYISQIMLSPTISLEKVYSWRAVGGEVGTIGLEERWGFQLQRRHRLWSGSSSVAGFPTSGRNYHDQRLNSIAAVVALF